jgi:hypothetical protein
VCALTHSRSVSRALVSVSIARSKSASSKTIQLSGAVPRERRHRVVRYDRNQPLVVLGRVLRLLGRRPVAEVGADDAQERVGLLDGVPDLVHEGRGRRDVASPPTSPSAPISACDRRSTNARSFASRR